MRAAPDRDGMEQPCLPVRPIASLFVCPPTTSNCSGCSHCTAALLHRCTLHRTLCARFCAAAAPYDSTMYARCSREHVVEQPSRGRGPLRFRAPGPITVPQRWPCSTQARSKHTQRSPFQPRACIRCGVTLAAARRRRRPCFVDEGTDSITGAQGETRIAQSRPAAG